jgi:serine/threonine protein phosphatase PrpC
MSHMRYEIGQASLLGDRTLNQDRYTLVESAESVLLALADGMGGHPKGEAAAQILVNTCKIMFSRARKPIKQPGRFLASMLQKAHEGIIAYGAKQTPPIKPRTTAVVALIQEDQVFCAHTGDSRFYLFRDGQILTRTLDHSYVELLREHRAISPDACEKHPYRNYVTRCLGGSAEPVEASISGPTPLQPNDTLLLCSDGLWGALDDERINRAMDPGQPLNQAIGHLALQATEAACPNSDNVTAVALRWLRGTSSGLLKATGTKNTPTPDPAQTDLQLEQAINDLKDIVESFETKHKQEH